MLQLMQLTDIGDTSCEQLGTRDEQSSMLYQLDTTRLTSGGSGIGQGRGGSARDGLPACRDWSQTPHNRPTTTTYESQIAMLLCQNKTNRSEGYRSTGDTAAKLMTYEA